MLTTVIRFGSIPVQVHLKRKFGCSGEVHVLERFAHLVQP